MVGGGCSLTQFLLVVSRFLISETSPYIKEKVILAGQISSSRRQPGERMNFKLNFYGCLDFEHPSLLKILPRQQISCRDQILDHLKPFRCFILPNLKINPRILLCQTVRGVIFRLPVLALLPCENDFPAMRSLFMWICSLCYKSNSTFLNKG